MGLLGTHVKAKRGRSKFETHLRNENKSVARIRDDSVDLKDTHAGRVYKDFREGGNEPSEPIETLHRRGVQRPRRSLAGLWPDSKISRIFDGFADCQRSFRVISRIHVFPLSGFLHVSYGLDATRRTILNVRGHSGNHHYFRDTRLARNEKSAFSHTLSPSRFFSRVKNDTVPI